MSFEPPPWTAPPDQKISLKTKGALVAIDQKPYYVLGREKEEVDIHLDSDKASRKHAAICHHTDGKVYLIDLCSSRGTLINGHRIAEHKPTRLQHNQRLSFGGLNQDFVVKCNEAGLMAGGKVRASHLLVKHKDVRRPSSWKEDVVTRTPAEALAKIEGFHAQLIAGDPSSLAERFAALASEESHCSSAKRGGDLGQFGPGQMQKAFEDATYALEVGELSGPIQSDSGVHLILRTE